MRGGRGPSHKAPPSLRARSVRRPEAVESSSVGLRRAAGTSFSHGKAWLAGRRRWGMVFVESSRLLRREAFFGQGDHLPDHQPSGGGGTDLIAHSCRVTGAHLRSVDLDVTTDTRFLRGRTRFVQARRAQPAIDSHGVHGLQSTACRGWRQGPAAWPPLGRRGYFAGPLVRDGRCNCRTANGANSTTGCRCEAQQAPRTGR